MFYIPSLSETSELIGYKLKAGVADQLLRDAITCKLCFKLRDEGD